MSELKIYDCPFCGGKGKVSFKDYRFHGKNYDGDKKVSYRVQVICNGCRSRGKPIITKPLINPNPYLSKWGNCYSADSSNCQKQDELFEPYVTEAIQAWNHRGVKDTFVSFGVGVCNE